MTTPLRILLVQPAWDGLGYRRKIKVDERAIHPLTLGVIAALSDPHEVHIVDEAREPVPMSARGFDVVGFSVNTFNAPRAYALADRFRAAGVPVVLGGPHTSLMTEACLKHADSVVIGDAEDTWPRRDLFRRDSRRVAWCQMSRGCANCRFCYLQYMPRCRDPRATAAPGALRSHSPGSRKGQGGGPEAFAEIQGGWPIAMKTVAGA